MKDSIDHYAKEFSQDSHGSSDFGADNFYVQGSESGEYVPFTFLSKKSEEFSSVELLKSVGYVVSSLNFLELKDFDKWYQDRFNKKLLQKDKKNIRIVHYPDSIKIFEAVEIVDQVYQIFKNFKVLTNGKNLPVQLGEWYAKIIFGLEQIKSSSQRGFDFYLGDKDKKVEIKVHWQDVTSPKGVKLKKSMLEMSEHTIIMYVSKNFKIRDVVLLDSDYILRKFSGKGHTIFLKDSDVSAYFFSKSNKHFDKIKNKSALMKFSNTNFAMKLDEKYQQLATNKE